MPKFTKRLVDALTVDPAGGDRFVWETGDGALKGFGIQSETQRDRFLLDPIPDP